MLSVPLVIFRRIQKKHMVSHSRYHIDNSCRKCSCQKSFASPLAYDRDQKKEADTCSANGVTLLRRPPSAPSDSPIVSNARGCAGALPTGLRKWCAGRYPSTSYTSSRSWMRRHGWYPTWGAPTTSLMLSSAYIGYPGAHTVQRTRSPCWRTKFCAALHHATSGRSLVLLTCTVSEVFAPLTPAVWSCRQSNDQPSAAEHFRLPPRRLGIHCLKTWHRHRLCDHSRSGWRLICLDSVFLY